MMTLDDAKAALPLPVLWARLGLPGNPPQKDGQLVSCPFPARHRHGDKKPSFNFHSSGGRFKCFGCDIEGGAVDLLALALGLDEKAACRKLIELAGGVVAPVSLVQAAHPTPGAPNLGNRERLQISALRRGNTYEWWRLRETRALCRQVVRWATDFGCLRFGEVCGFPSWILLDGAGRAAEARRLNRQAFPSLGSLGERKAHFFKGTDKSWPVGVDVLRVHPSFRAVLLVEGTPDFLAALHFMYEHDICDVWPLAMLGRSTGGMIHPEALELLRGRKVRIFPHADADGGGVAAAKKWARQLAAVGCVVDAFSFAGLRQRDGSPVKDLNDCCAIHPDDEAILGGLLP